MSLQVTTRAQHGLLAIPILCRIGRGSPWEASVFQSGRDLAMPR